jgi:hypothetical protein
MQSKTCPTCNETYQIFIDYCFRDGTKLILPGTEPDIEETELLTNARRVSAVDVVQNIDAEDKTTPIIITGKNREKEAGAVIEEELDAPVVIGNTQMLKKEDLMAMFQDDSTYNGELIDPEDETATFDSDPETEELEATETFDLSARASFEKTEFEETPPLMGEHIQPTSSDTFDPPLQEKNTAPVQIEQSKSPASPPHYSKPESSPIPTDTSSQFDVEKEPPTSPLFLLGGLLGLVVVVIGFFLFYPISNNDTDSSTTSVQKERSIQKVEANEVAVVPAQPEAAPTITEPVVEKPVITEELRQEEPTPVEAEQVDDVAPEEVIREDVQEGMEEEEVADLEREIAKLESLLTVQVIGH